METAETRVCVFAGEGSSTVDSGSGPAKEGDQSGVASGGGGGGGAGAPTTGGGTDRDSNPLEPFLVLDEGNRRLQGKAPPISCP